MCVAASREAEKTAAPCGLSPEKTTASPEPSILRGHFTRDEPMACDTEQARESSRADMLPKIVLVSGE
jgi:hypothetical protein